jgi:adenosylcobinamide-phosphate synthase
MTLPKHWPSAAGLAVGFMADRVFGDPKRGHPVAGFGAAASWLEARCYADRETAGVVHAAALVGTAIGLGATLERLISNRSWATVMTAGS